jgi:tRNA A37 threonylcarbamoyladenosine dehydratase
MEGDYDYVIDAFDMYKQKAHLVINCSKRKLPVIHSMGAANRFDPTKFKIGKLKDVKSDYLAQGLKKQLKLAKKDIRYIKCVYSTEVPVKKTPPASLAFTPMAAGNLIASYVFTQLIKE